ncbi:mannosyltransferase family protein [Streptomyces sp. NPDC050610]|uniref:mannosyltransferase family protein n=1 Tax=Streptomyces sp. NPDC050610 TaxID=3157097 RepID=UPI003426A46D
MRPVRDGTGHRLRRALRRAAPALLGYVAVRLLGVVVLAKWAHLKGHGFWPQLANQWDSRWYLGIANRGYDDVLTGVRNTCNLAFFPLYPFLVKAFSHPLPPGHRASTGLVLSVTASLLAAWGVFAVGDRLYGHRVGAVLAVLWGVTPVALVQWMGYTESLFTALAAWSLYAVLTGRWVWAGTLSAFAGLTRPTGVALAAAVSVSALMALRGARREGAGVTGSPPVARMVTGCVLAPLGWLGYLVWVAVRLGRWDGYFAVQRTWTNQLDGGVETLRSLRETLTYQARPELFLVVVSIVIMLSAALYAVCVAQRQPPPLLIFTGALLVIVLCSGGVYFPRARFLLPGFPLLLPFALAIARARRRTALLVLGGAALFSAYFGAYMALVWPSAP